MQTKPLLTIDKHINDMRGKGVTFNVISEKQAREILLNHTYYFKLEVFLTNFARKNNKYINADFASIYEVSKIDLYFRRMVGMLALDIEHYLKVSIIRDLEQLNDKTIKKTLDEFLAENSKNSLKSRTRNNDVIASMPHDNDSKNEDMPFSAFIEVMQLGELSELYLFFYERFKFKKKE